ncbi:MAG: hypothetical protein IJ560_03890 [Alphaproteobacteria bacterium]|nr:hypothetical protein [Alphaproteobacteria bacterium]
MALSKCFWGIICGVGFAGAACAFTLCNGTKYKITYVCANRASAPEAVSVEYGTNFTTPPSTSCGGITAWTYNGTTFNPNRSYVFSYTTDITLTGTSSGSSSGGGSSQGGESDDDVSPVGDDFGIPYIIDSDDRTLQWLGVGDRDVCGRDVGDYSKIQGWYVSFPYPGYLAGVASCAKDSGRENLATREGRELNKDEILGQYCWCRLDEADNGMGPRSFPESKWVYLEERGWNTTDCACSCASMCAEKIRVNYYLREAILQAAGVTDTSGQ